MDSDEAEAERLDWEEVWEVIEPHMSRWHGDGERLWGAHAWGTLAEAGLTRWTTEVDRTRCVLRALALAALSRDFYARAFEEGDDEEWRHDISTDVIGERPRIDAFTLGQLAERSGIEADNTWWNEEEGEVAEVVRALVAIEYPAVARALRAGLGDAELFAALWAVRDSEPSYPLADGYIDDVVNGDPTPEKMVAWEWVTQVLSEP